MTFASINVTMKLIHQNILCIDCLAIVKTNTWMELKY